MHILMERAAITSYVGNDDLDAEIQICDDDGKTVYINAHYGDDCTCFSAGYTSNFDYATKGSDAGELTETVEYIEEYEELEETEESKYAKYYKIAERMIDDIADDYKQ